MERLIPINDLNKSDYSPEDVLRLKLAGMYRLVDLKGWGQNIYNHITLRCEDNPNHFLINPFTLHYSEVTASNLIKIDQDGNIVDRGSTLCGINIAGFNLHKVIHEHRKDLNCVIHVHTGPGTAVSCFKQGLLPVTQEALFCGEISYVDYDGIVEEHMGEKIAAGFSNPDSKVLILRNHGILTAGATLEEAWIYLMNLILACNAQIHLMASGQLDHLIFPEPAIRDQVQSWLVKGVNTSSRNGDNWGLGELEFEAEMRRLDRMGYQTGYPYRLKIYP